VFKDVAMDELVMVAFHYSIPTRPNPTSLKVVEDLVAVLVYD